MVLRRPKLGIVVMGISYGGDGTLAGEQVGKTAWFGQVIRPSIWRGEYYPIA
jgi:hypothetical protein